MILHSSFRLKERRNFNKVYAATTCSNIPIPAGNRSRCGIIPIAALWTLCRCRHKCHSTGHESRLNRSTLTAKAGFGSNPYSKEELIAELGAAFLCGQADIVERTLDNSAAYVKSWLEQLRNDKALIVHAAAQAQKAADFILGTTFAEAQAPAEN